MSRKSCKCRTKRGRKIHTRRCKCRKSIKRNNTRRKYMRGGWGGVKLPEITLFKEKETEKLGGYGQMGDYGQMGGWGEAIGGI